MERIGEAVEAERARERDDVAAVDQPPSEPALRLAELVEMHLGGVLIEAGRDLMLGLLDRDAVDMVDPLARGVIAPAVRRAGEREVVGGDVERRAGGAEVVGRDGGRKIGNLGRRRGRFGVAFAHHHPADIFDDRLAALIEAAGSNPDDAALLGSSFP